jgi:ubiquinone biosynthesis protein COQ4
MLQDTDSFAPRRALTAVAQLLRDPDDLPKVFTVIEALSGSTRERLIGRLRASAPGARLLRDRPDIRPILEDRAALGRLPEGSLGRAYLAFMESEGISAAGIVSASDEGRSRAIEDTTEGGWFERRMRDTHDLWHAVTGYRGDVLGEVGLLAFILAQTRNPGVGLIVFAALLKTHRERSARELIFDGFARGRRAAWLVEVEWEALLALPVEAVRARLGIDAPPVYTPVRSAEIRARAAA